jgi:hypothetical protein
MFNSMRPILFTLCFLFPVLLATNESARAQYARPVTTGVAYPNTGDAVATDPAALGDQGNKVGRIVYDPSHGYSGIFASSSNGSSSYGLALNSLNSGNLTFGYGTGGQAFHVGANVSLTGLPGSIIFGVSAIAGGNDGWRLATNIGSVTTSDRVMTLGLGYARNNQFQIEGDLKVAVSSLTGAGNVYTLNIAAVKYWSAFGFGLFSVSTAGIHPLATTSPDFGATLQFYLGSQTSIDIRYSRAPGSGLGAGLLTRL